MKTTIIQLLFVGLLLGCSGNKGAVETIAPLDCNIYKVEVPLDEDFYEAVTNQISDTSFVVLKEKGDVMFSFADKIIESKGRYYVLDRSALRVVVSFNGDGTYHTKYGRVGQGPGEYVFPWDICVDETGVYVLDTNSKKVIHYSEAGDYLGERKIPFFADAIKRLNNGNFIFNTTPDGTQKPGLIYTDSLMNTIAYSLPYQDGYVGGCATSDVFRSHHSGLCYYRSPSDSLAMLDEEGKIHSFIVFDFLDRAIPQKAKTDYLAFRQSKYAADYLRLVNNPMMVSDSIWVGLVEDGDNQYTIVFDPFTNKCGCRKFTDSSSVYDMIEPMFSDGKGTMVSLISHELEDRCRDYESLPDSIKNALEDGNRVLLLHKFL